MVGFVCACVILRLILMARIPLSAPEAYYWEWSKNLAWGYFDHPPMIAYLIKLFTLIGGDGEFYVRLGPLVLSILSTVVFYHLAKDMFGPKTALVACGIIQIIPFFATASIVSVPDAPLAFFWILTVYLVNRATILNHHRLWYAVGISLGLALLSKYHAFLLIPCVLIYLLVSKDMRPWLGKKEPYLALLLGLLIFLPNLYWNIDHSGTTFRFLLVERHETLGFSLKGVFKFIGGVMAFLSPLFALLVLRLLPRLGRAALRERDNRYLLLLSTSLPPIGFFALFSPFISVGAHWVAVGYMALCLATISAIMENRGPKGMSLFHGFPLASIFFSMGLVLFAYVAAIAVVSVPPAITFAGRTYDLRIADPQKEIYGWDELGEKLTEKIKVMPNPDRTFIITHSYRVASHVRYFVGAEFLTRTTGYEEWQNQYLIWDDILSLKGWDALFVDKQSRRSDLDLLQRIFERVGPMEEVEIKMNHIKARSFYVIRCYGYKGRYISEQDISDIF